MIEQLAHFFPTRMTQSFRQSLLLSSHVSVSSYECISYSPSTDFKALEGFIMFTNQNIHLWNGKPMLREFWDVLFEWSPEMQKRFLRFVTGSDRVPVGGMAEMVSFIQNTLCT